MFFNKNYMFVPIAIVKYAKDVEVEVLDTDTNDATEVAANAEAFRLATDKDYTEIY